MKSYLAGTFAVRQIVTGSTGTMEHLLQDPAGRKELVQLNEVRCPAAGEAPTGEKSSLRGGDTRVTI